MRASLGFDDIFKQEKLQASDEEIEAEFKRAVADFDRVGHEYDEDKLREQARETIKVLMRSLSLFDLRCPSV